MTLILILLVFAAQTANAQVCPPSEVVASILADEIGRQNSTAPVSSDALLKRWPLKLTKAAESDRLVVWAYRSDECFQSLTFDIDDKGVESLGVVSLSISAEMSTLLAAVGDFSRIGGPKLAPDDFTRLARFESYRDSWTTAQSKLTMREFTMEEKPKPTLTFTFHVGR